MASRFRAAATSRRADAGASFGEAAPGGSPASAAGPGAFGAQAYRPSSAGGAAGYDWSATDGTASNGAFGTLGFLTGGSAGSSAWGARATQLRAKVRTHGLSPSSIFIALGALLFFIVLFTEPSAPRAPEGAADTMLSGKPEPVAYDGARRPTFGTSRNEDLTGAQMEASAFVLGSQAGASSKFEAGASRSMSGEQTQAAASALLERAALDGASNNDAPKRSAFASQKSGEESSEADFQSSQSESIMNALADPHSGEPMSARSETESLQSANFDAAQTESSRFESSRGETKDVDHVGSGQIQEPQSSALDEPDRDTAASSARQNSGLEVAHIAESNADNMAPVSKGENEIRAQALSPEFHEHSENTEAFGPSRAESLRTDPEPAADRQLDNILPEKAARNKAFGSASDSAAQSESASSSSSSNDGSGAALEVDFAGMSSDAGGGNDRLASILKLKATEETVEMGAIDRARKARMDKEGFLADFTFSREPMFATESESLREQLRGRALIPTTIPPGAEIVKQKFADRIIVSEKNKMLYCPVPKAGNSNWKVLIRKHEGFSNYKLLDVANNKNINGLTYLSQLAPERVDEIMRDPSWFRFSIVRDPYKRHLSCYLNKFQNKAKVSQEYQNFYKQLIHYRFTPEEIVAAEKPTFREFTQHILKKHPQYLNEHWAHQYYICGFGMVPFDFIGKLENIVNDSAVAFEALGWHGESFPSQAQIGFHSSGTSSKTAEYYDDAIYDAVSQKFARDLEILEYPRRGTGYALVSD